jgi:hypothetical protein
MPSIQSDKEKHVIWFDLNEEVIKPFSMGYAREAYVKLDSIIDKLLEYLIRRKFPSDDAQKLMSLLSGSRASGSFAQIAYEADIITSSKKERINRFRAIRNVLTHNSLGELELIVGKKRGDIGTLLKEELDKGVAVAKELASGDPK